MGCSAFCWRSADADSSRGFGSGSGGGPLRRREVDVAGNRWGRWFGRGLVVEVVLRFERRERVLLGERGHVRQLDRLESRRRTARDGDWIVGATRGGYGSPGQRDYQRHQKTRCSKGHSFQTLTHILKKKSPLLGAGLDEPEAGKAEDRHARDVGGHERRAWLGVGLFPASGPHTLSGGRPPKSRRGGCGRSVRNGRRKGFCLGDFWPLEREGASAVIRPTLPSPRKKKSRPVRRRRAGRG